MSFLHNETNNLCELKNIWPHANLTKNINETYKTIQSVFNFHSADQKIKIWVKGTPFQVKVWEALLKVPFGGVTTYRHIASQIQNPLSVRAVGTAVGSNPVAYLIPCHRVIRNEGIIGQYRWGNDRKTAMIGWEKSKSECV
jgi:AraC family transcriptional regulator of adaptative response/methylated-DNA-[protein]-cysteine methyltransferase